MSELKLTVSIVESELKLTLHVSILIIMESELKLTLSTACGA